MNQGCLKTFALGQLWLGVLLALLGLVFLLAPGRAGTGLIMLLIGGAIIAFSASRLRVMKNLSPEGVEQQLQAAAAASGGELTVTEAVALTALEDGVVRAGLERLLHKDLVRLERRDGSDYYIFPGLTETKMIKKCPYCGNEYPLKQAGRTCPSCGGNLEIRPE
ncbi:MAG: hypothetical protein ABFD96_05675 [Armatimonadia bacterium]